MMAETVPAIPPNIEIDMPRECMSNGCHRRALPLGIYVKLEDGVEFYSPCKIHVDKALQMFRMIASTPTVGAEEEEV